MYGQNGRGSKPYALIALEEAFRRLKGRLEEFERGEQYRLKDRIFISAEQVLRANKRAWESISTSRSYVAKEGLRQDREAILERHRLELTTGRYATLLEAHPETQELLGKLWPSLEP